MRLIAADLFCGAGGFTSGLQRAARELGLEVDLLAVNHWPVAIETHSKNHPGVFHYCESIEGVDPRRAVPGGRMHLLMASPCCTHHSNARGGKPMSDQSRATAWHVLRWAEELYVDHILIENVREFRGWGPLDDAGRPIPSMKGRLYRQFLSSLRALGYAVDERILNAADYGDATTRHRLFIQARRGRRRPSWPAPTHTPGDALGLYPEAKPWRSAREIIDWDLPGRSIYDRKKPLAEKTMLRILAGLHKYGGLPFIFGVGGPEGQGPARGVNDPLRTALTRSGLALAEPFLVVLRNNCDARPLDRPLPTLTTARNVGLATPFLVPLTHGGGPARAHSADAPLPTITTAHRGELAVCRPYFIEYHGEKAGQPPRCRAVEAPLSTIDTSNRLGLVQPFLVNYHGNGRPLSVDDPLDTIDTRDRFALISPELVHSGFADKGDVVGWLDIRFRMLQPHELAAAHSFPTDYQFAGTRDDQVRQIGNSVGVGQAAALCREAIRGMRL